VSDAKEKAKQATHTLAKIIHYLFIGYGARGFDRLLSLSKVNIPKNPYDDKILPTSLPSPDRAIQPPEVDPAL